jgi:site-specific recombinase XerD
MTLNHFAIDWRLENLSEKTIAEYLRVLRKIELSHPLPLDLPTAKLLVAAEQDRGMKSSTVVFFVRALKAYHRWWAEEHEQPDPLARLKFAKQEQPPPGKIVQDDEIERLLDVFDSVTFEDIRNRAMIRVCCPIPACAAVSLPHSDWTMCTSVATTRSWCFRRRRTGTPGSCRSRW